MHLLFKSHRKERNYKQKNTIILAFIFTYRVTLLISSFSLHVFELLPSVLSSQPEGLHLTPFVYLESLNFSFIFLKDSFA